MTNTMTFFLTYTNDLEFFIKFKKNIYIYIYLYIYIKDPLEFLD